MQTFFDNLLAFFSRPKPLQDALIDERPFSERQKNWLDIEFAMGSDEYKWEEEDFTDSPYFPYNQSSSLSCVALAPAIWLEHFEKSSGREVISSRKDAYIRRYNKPSGGMAMYDMINISRAGVALENQVFSQGLSETPMNAPYPITQEILETRSKNKIKGAVYLTQKNSIDEIAKATRNSPVSIFLGIDTNAQSIEYWTVYPKIVNRKLNVYASDASRHQVVVLKGVLINGVKYLKIQDSAGLGSGTGRNRNIRYLSEDFVKYRVFDATWSIPEFNVQPPTNKLKWTGKRDLKVGMVGDDVRRLQQILQKEGCFDFPNPTGYFGGITRASVIKLQNKYAKEILHPVGLKYGTGNVAKSTRAWLEKNYA